MVRGRALAYNDARTMPTFVLCGVVTGVQWVLLLFGLDLDLDLNDETENVEGEEDADEAEMERSEAIETS